MLFGSLLLGYSYGTTIWKDLPYVITSIALGLLCYLFIACLLVFFGTCMKNFGSALVMYFVVVFILTLVGSLTPFASSFFEVENNKVLKDLFDFISNINIFYYPSNVIGIVEKYKNEETDTTIYSFNKIISLLKNTNPNIIEMLGLKPEHYL